jgi:hypothetical protein
VNILHRLTFVRGSEALDFVRTLRELTDIKIGGEMVGVGPVLVYGARIISPDTPAELYVSLGTLTLAHVLGMDSLAFVRVAPSPLPIELPLDMALLFTAVPSSGETPLRGA